MERDELAQALPPAMPVEAARAGLENGSTPGGSVAPTINFLTSAVDGRATGNIPSDWECGVCWDQVGCSSTCLWLNECDELYDADNCPNPDAKEYNEILQAKAWAFDIPFGVSKKCRHGDQATLAAIEQQARQGLDALTPVKMANRLAQSLQFHAEKLPGTKCPPIETAIGMLFEARAATGAGGGVITLSDRLGGVAQASNLMTRGGTRYSSLYGAPVIVGPGINNVGPQGEAAPAGTGWMFISSPVDYAISPIERISDQISWDAARQNDIAKVLVERRGLVRHDQCNVFAICVTLPTDTCAQTTGG